MRSFHFAGVAILAQVTGFGKNVVPLFWVLDWACVSPDQAAPHGGFEEKQGFAVWLQVWWRDLS